MLTFHDEKCSFPHFLTVQIASTKVETALWPENLCFNPAQRDKVKTYFSMEVTLLLLRVKPAPAQAGTFRIDRWLDHDR